ncbi:MAG: hypothetical protein U0271_01825 [Polyangiaceae bacterium]
MAELTVVSPVTIQEVHVMVHGNSFRLALFILPLFALACGDDGPSGGSGGQGGNVQGGGGAGASGGDNFGGGAQEFGFTIRTPEERSVTCSDYPNGGSTDPITFADSDWLCTYDYEGVTGYVYIASTPVDCEWTLDANPVFATKRAQISIDGVVTDLVGAAYDWGGNHHNDSLSFTYDSKNFQYYHSSFGFGFRSCQNMDCATVSANDTLLEDGCTKDRTLPIVCQEIQPDGTHGDFVDTFMHCAGDPNFP